MKLTITTESYLLAGSGESTLLIDADTVFHHSGFPYLPARRIKGLLKSSALEVLEMTRGTEATAEHPLITNLFGRKGDEIGNAKIKVRNLYIKNWKEIYEEWNVLKDKEGYKHALKPSFIQQYFTEEITQTSIENNIAKDSSLRNYRVIKPGNDFEADIAFSKDITDAERALFYLAVLNLKHIGTRRNRGFGAVKCGLSEIGMSIGNAVHLLRQWQESDSGSRRAPVSSLQNISSTNSERCTMSITISLQSPVLVAGDKADQNTVETASYISGSRIRGVIAAEIIKKCKLGRSAHEDSFFYEAILSGNVAFSHAWPIKNQKTAQPIPLHLQKEKGKDDEEQAVNIFLVEEDEPNIKNGKPAGRIGFSFNDGYQKYAPQVSAMFHNARSSRLSGKSNDGTIFYYESLNAGQEFKATITGSKSLLLALKEALGDHFDAGIGRSRSAQYAETSLSFNEVNNVETKVKEDDEARYVLTCLSPLILLNEYGLSAPTVQNLERYLDVLGIKAKVEKAVSTFQSHEHYIGIWKSKTEQVTAFKEGTSFLLRVEETGDLVTLLKQLQASGLGENRSSGYGSISVQPLSKERSNPIVREMNIEDDNYNSMSPDLLQPIIEEYDKNHKINKLKVDAVRSANLTFRKNTESKHPSNHLISRMIQLLNKATSKEQFIKWLADLEQKPAGEDLKKANLLNCLKNDEKDWPQYTLYWKTFFKSVRKINKRNDRTTKESSTAGKQ